MQFPISDKEKIVEILNTKFQNIECEKFCWKTKYYTIRIHGETLLYLTTFRNKERTYHDYVKEDVEMMTSYGNRTKRLLYNRRFPFCALRNAEDIFSFLGEKVPEPNILIDYEYGWKSQIYDTKTFQTAFTDNLKKNSEFFTDIDIKRNLFHYKKWVEIDLSKIVWSPYSHFMFEKCIRKRIFFCYMIFRKLGLKKDITLGKLLPAIAKMSFDDMGTLHKANTHFDQKNLEHSIGDQRPEGCRSFGSRTYTYLSHRHDFQNIQIEVKIDIPIASKRVLLRIFPVGMVCYEDLHKLDFIIDRISDIMNHTIKNINLEKAKIDIPINTAYTLFSSKLYELGLKKEVKSAIVRYYMTHLEDYHKNGKRIDFRSTVLDILEKIDPF